MQFTKKYDIIKRPESCKLCSFPEYVYDMEMHYNEKALGLSMAVLMITSCAVGCGDKDSSSDSKSSKDKYVGKWECEKMVVEGQEMTEFFGIPLASVMQFEFKDDGTCSVMEEMTGDEDEPATGKWEADGDKVTLTVESTEEDADGEDESMEFEYKDGKLVATEEEDGQTAEIYLVKVDEFTTFDAEALADSFSFDDDSGDFDIDDSDIDWEE